MKSRLVAPLALGLAVAFGATGCSMVSSQATTIDYSPSDGVNVPASGPVVIRNAMVIANAEGTQGNFVANLVNDTDTDAQLNINFGRELTSVSVPARATVNLGIGQVEPLLIDGLGTKAGQTLLTSFQSGDGEGAEIAVPVLDGALPYYEEFVPGGWVPLEAPTAPGHEEDGH